MGVGQDIALTLLISAQDQASSIISKIGGPIGLLSAAALAAGFAAVKMAGDFQQGLTVLSTGAGEAQKNLQMVGDGLKQISIDTGTSTDQLLKGMFMIESGGYHAQQGLDVMRVAAEGARLENADLGAVSFSLTGLLHDYGMASTQAAAAMNALIVTESSGKMRMQDLTTSLGNVLPLAATLGVAFPQIGAAIAVMTNANMTARRATQNLNFELRALSAPSAVAVKAMESVGLSAQQVRDTLTKQGLDAAIQLITVAVGQTFPKGSVAWTEAMKAINGGATGLNVALMLSGTHMKEFQADVTKITAAMNQGKAGVMGWAQVQDTFNFKMSQLHDAVNVALIDLGEKLLPVLGNIATATTGVVGGFANVLTYLTPTSPALAIMAGILATLLVPALYAAATAAWGFAAALLANPITWIALAIGVAVAGIVLAIQHWGQITQWLGEQAALAQGIWTTFTSWVGGAFSQLGTDANNAKNAIGGFFSWLGTQIHNTIGAQGVQNMLSAMVGAIQSIFAQLGPAFAQIGTAFSSLGTAAQGLWGALQQLWGTLQQVWAALQQLWGIIGPVLVGAFQALVQAIAPLWPLLVGLWGALQKIWAIIQPYLLPALVLLAGVIVGTVIVALGLLLSALMAGIQLITNIATGLINVFTGIVTFFKGIAQIIGGVVQFIVDLCTGKFNKLGADLQVIWNGIQMAWNGLWQAITGIFQATIGALFSAFGTFVHTIIGFFQGLYTNLTGQTTTATTQIAAAHQTMASKIDLTHAAMAAYVQRTTQTMATNSISTVQTMSDKAVQLFTQMNQGAQSQMSQLNQAAIQYWNSIAAYVEKKDAEMEAATLAAIAKMHQAVSTFQTPGGGTVTGTTGGHFASGGPVMRTGLYTVGEHGTENVVLPGGSYVYPHGAGPSVANVMHTPSGGGGGNLYLTINAPGSTKEQIQQISDAIDKLWGRKYRTQFGTIAGGGTI
jgi:TP901 family phage tail tape measure protein